MSKKQYEVKLGNLEQRRGHRPDCAQISAVAKVKASTAVFAIEIVKSLLHDGETYVIEIVPGVTVEITFNAKTVHEVTCG